MSSILGETWSSVADLQDEIIGFVFSLLVLAVTQLLRPRVKLIYGRANNSRNVLAVPDTNDPQRHNPTEVYAEKFFLQNVGKKPATSVEFVLSAPPADVSVWRPSDTLTKLIGKGEFFVGIPSIAPGELVVIDCVYINQRASFVSSVKCAEAVGREVPFQTVRQFGPGINFLIALAMLLGVAFAAQVMFKLFTGA